ncbi:MULTISPECIES: sulfite exporter TauE/SafE family protein [unclassified Modestobacter]|uniref:sulfite exporter TauE/SafE family protein n=1 Tax=unclassified Modestobacter TaxID=2643866 RepID=UPI0022AB3913|nr:MULTISPECIES: sulfite exporter TauE/SafE family protein [unclassified Modestobacter]MCZ2825640.1 sulfite exporter TauE/SafE family protein [Modestobacter sp. VKM Ac-2981]MCZ2853295.1 sulfite exporter TauE/SafE family protein [Modestobacter sp. VKM Ac-2982]
MEGILLVAGGVVVFLASVLAGGTGFGYSLVCAPLLLLAGIPLADVVVINLTVGVVTRIGAVLRLRHSVDRQRSTYLVAGCVPGLLLGHLVLDRVDADALKVTAGVVAVVAAGFLLLRRPAVPPGEPGAPSRLAPGVAGVLGGFLGITTSMNGPPPVILLSHRNVAPRAFIADMAVYLLACNTMALAVIGLTGGLSLDRVGLLLACWLPGAVLGNLLGVAYGSRLPLAPFRLLTLGLVMVTGLATVATSIGGL